MMTHPSDIAGLSERLRADAKCWAVATNTVTGPYVAALETEAATALDSLSARVKELEGSLRDWQDSSEAYRKDFEAAESRALRAEQQRDEAYERAAKVAHFYSATSEDQKIAATQIECAIRALSTSADTEGE